MRNKILLHLLIAASICSTGCKKAAIETADIYKYIPPAGQAINDAAPLCGSIKGTMLAGKTYIIGCDVIINRGDPL